ncbi:MAG: carbohydrate binding family 9 domain-containing protein, partial [Candidatus Aminicenantes bacterium]|nr:carbohydrate binding family 9 domain-containing protein [Candidatus Aminicenantes bacterium]
MRLTLPVFFLFIIISIPCMAFAASNKNDTYHVVVPEFLKSPKIDGKLEKALWEKAAVLESFTQYEPREGTEPSEKTVAYIGYDRKNLYIAIRCYDSDPKEIRRTLTQRDKVFGDDGITVYLDTFNDKKRAFAFEVNPCGVQSDGVYTETKRRRRGMGFNKIDKNWDTYFLANARIDKEGYTVEISIPFKSLRFPNSDHQIWGLQIMRNIQRKNEEIYWHPRSRSINGFLIQAGEIRIDGELDTGKNLEIMPVATGLKTTGELFVPEAGLNLKYGLTSDLTADLTLNPDFSQVEADMPQIDVNQRFALYYPEKRPFFLEGKDFFDTPLELVYTRTIVNPDIGVKLTGKFGRTTVGFLSTYDTNPTEID